jgi:uncharacterized protein (DUF305 family)
MTPLAVKRRGRRTLALVLGVGIGLVAAFFLGRTSGREEAPGRPGPVDIGFSQDMATHHTQAVLMANLAADRAGPAVKAIAGGILVTQSQELGALHGWLRLWGQAAESMTPMSWMSGAMHQHDQMAGMPGMASSRELTALWAKSGNDFDVTFLRLMIRHHQGGVIMARAGEAQATLEVVRQTARSMHVQQAEEIGQMQALLASYGAAPLPPPS